MDPDQDPHFVGLLVHKDYQQTTQTELIHHLNFAVEDFGEKIFLGPNQTVVADDSPEISNLVMQLGGGGGGG